MYYGNHKPMYVQNNQKISVQQAQQIAYSRVPGQVLNVYLVMENGILVYEVYVMTPQNRVYQVEINPKTGSILKIEQENDDDFLIIISVY